MAASAEQGRPLRVLVVGAGIGGLTAALAFRRQGHEVLVFEKSKFASEIGAAINLAINCNRLLRRLGVRAEEYGGVVAKTRTSYDGSGQHMVWENSMILPGNETDAHKVDFMIHRAHLHNGLKSTAFSEDGDGQPARLFLDCHIVELDKAASTIKLANGQEFSGDLIIGADGVHSYTRQFIAPDAEVYPFGSFAYRWLIPKETLITDERSREYAEQEGNFLEWETGDRKVIYYPFENRELCNCVAFVPDEEVPSPGSDSKAIKEALLKSFQDFGPQARAVLEHAPETSLKVWPLLDMRPLERWTDECLVLTGDASHPFTPFLGMGAAMAIEDGISLSIMFPLGTAAADIPSRLKLWEQSRMERVNSIQEWSRHNGPSNDDALKHDLQESWGFLKSCMVHDAWATAEQVLANGLSPKHQA